MSRAKLIHDNITVLARGILLLEELDDDLYSRPEPRVSSDGVGCHVRHCLDFYASLLDGLAAGQVDYDSRERDTRVETDRAAALERMHATADRVRAIPDPAGDVVLLVRQDSGGWAESSIDRELQVTLSHTVHHFALIGMLLRLNGHEVDRAFGVAPSTLRHWEDSDPCAP